MRKFIYIIPVLALLASCNNLTSSNNGKVIQQDLACDSLYNKFHKFDIQLYTTIEFDKRELSRREYNDFLIVIAKDTFALVPEINDLKINHNISKIEYSSRIDFSSKTYKNDSISNIIKDSYIITTDGVKIEKSKNYKLESIVSLGYKEKDVKKSGATFGM